MTLEEPPAPQEGPILAKLVEAGYDVGSLAELRHSGVRYRKAVPIMTAALSETTEQKTLMELVRVLSVPWAKPDATGPLLDLFRRVEDSTGLGLRWAVGNALDVTGDDARFDAPCRVGSRSFLRTCPRDDRAWAGTIEAP